MLICVRAYTGIGGAAARFLNSWQVLVTFPDKTIEAYKRISALVERAPQQAEREWLAFQQSQPSYGDPEGIQAKLNALREQRSKLSRLVALSPLSYIRLLVWIFWAPSRLEAYQRAYGKDIPTSYWLASLIVWTPLFLLHLAAVLEKLPIRWRYDPLALPIIPIVALVAPAIAKLFFGESAPSESTSEQHDVSTVSVGIVIVAVAVGVFTCIVAGAAIGAVVGVEAVWVPFVIIFAVVSGMSFAVISATSASGQFFIVPLIVLGAVTGSVTNDFNQSLMAVLALTVPSAAAVAAASMLTNRLRTILIAALLTAFAAIFLVQALFDIRVVEPILTAGMSFIAVFIIAHTLEHSIARLAAPTLLLLGYAALIWLLFFDGWQVFVTLPR